MRALILLATLCAANAEVHTLTLRQTAALALAQGPDALLARLDRQKAAAQVDLARDAFHPKFYAGSGLAYVYGFPQSIEGSAPAVVQARGVASVYDRRQSFLVKEARESERGANETAERKRERALGEAIGLHLEAERLGRVAAGADALKQGAKRIARSVEARLAEGRQIQLDLDKANLEIARAEQKITEWEGARDHLEAMLAAALGMPEGDRVRPAAEDRTLPIVPESPIEDALRQSREIRELESALAAAGLRIEAERSARYPKMDLVAQYGLFAKFNNYEDYFRRFQRNNAQIGVSLQVPLWLGPAAKAAVSQAEAAAASTRIELNRARGRVRLETEQRSRAVRETEIAQNLARRELDVARSEVAVELARMEEGRVPVDAVERARMAEQERWIAYLAARERSERARYALLEQTGQLAVFLAGPAEQNFPGARLDKRQ
ncbi:MAG: TolC family protein [Bryobacteraceae bacterium]